MKPLVLERMMVVGLNIPACAAPLMLALLRMAAASGPTAADLGRSFVSLATFGLALSFPRVLAVFFAPARATLLCTVRTDMTQLQVMLDALDLVTVARFRVPRCERKIN